jgi:hypothetical protein
VTGCPGRICPPSDKIACCRSGQDCHARRSLWRHIYEPPSSNGYCIISTALLGPNTYTKDVDPGTTAERHKETAAKLWLIRESYLSLITDIHVGGLPPDEIRSRRDTLQDALGAVYAGAPRTTSGSCMDASLAL